MADGGHTAMTPKRSRDEATAAELFSAWIDAGAPTYREFAALLVQRNRYKNATTALGCIGRIASRDRWLAKKAEALTAAAEAKLEEAASIDADIYLATSRLLADRIKYTTHHHLDAIIAIRTSVRRSTPKSEVSVKHSGTVKHDHRDLTVFTDDEIANLAAVAERAKVERA